MRYFLIAMIGWVVPQLLLWPAALVVAFAAPGAPSPWFESMVVYQIVVLLCGTAFASVSLYRLSSSWSARIGGTVIHGAVQFGLGVASFLLTGALYYTA